MDRRRVLVECNRLVLTYVYLYHAAYYALEQANQTEEGRFYNCMTANILSAFTVEAYLNHIGNELLPYWDQEIKKGLSTPNKMKIICHHLSLNPDYSRRPFQSFVQLVKFRNLTAHGETATLSKRTIKEFRDGEHAQYPETWWQKHSNLATAKRWLEDSESMISTIHKSAGNDVYPFAFFAEGGSASQLL